MDSRVEHDKKRIPTAEMSRVQMNVEISTLQKIRNDDIRQALGIVPKLGRKSKSFNKNPMV